MRPAHHRASFFVGIDPGKSGAIASLRIDHEVDFPIVGTYTMPLTRRPDYPNTVDLEEFLGLMRSSTVFDRMHGLSAEEQLVAIGIERQQVIPRSSARSTLPLIANYGSIITAVDAFQQSLPKPVPVRLVYPREWKQYFGLAGGKKNKWQSIHLAQAKLGYDHNDPEAMKKMWPDGPPFDQLKHEGQAEATLIAFYLYETTARQEKPDAE